MKEKKKRQFKLLPKLILSLGITGLVLTVSISMFSYLNTKSYLLEMASDRVMTNCDAIAAMLNVDDVKAILGKDGDKTDAYKRTLDNFNTIKKEGNVTYLSLTVPNADSVTFYIDSISLDMGDDPANQMAYGSTVYYKDAANPNDPNDYQKYITIYNAFAENKGLDAPIITDNSYGYNYTGISVVLDENGKAIAEVQYIIDMRKIRYYLNSFLIYMFLISFGIIAIVLLIYVVVIRRMITKPIGKLAEFTQSITSNGTFKGKRIEINTRDEIETLGDSFNYMLDELEIYIANLSKVTSEKERIGAELDIAKNIQASMLPCLFPAFPHRKEFNIYATMTPAKEVGGDFYDFFMVDESHLAIVVADVSGKGVPAALFMVIGKTLIKDHTQSGKDLGQVFTEVNNLLCESNSQGLFITAFEGVLDLTTGQFDFVNAGHEMPFILQNGSFEPKKIKPRFVLAGMENIRYSAGSMFLEPGDKIFEYTDGVTEATNERNELFGMERLQESLNKVKDDSPEEILKAVKNDIDDFVGDAPQFDDITMLCLDFKQKMSSKDEETITLPAKVENLDSLLERVDEMLEKMECPLKVQTQIDVAIDEIFSNICFYAYAPKEGEATIILEGLNDPKGISITFIDNGKPYNPLEKEDPDVTLSLEKREIGGLGIYMVKKTMDEVCYEYKNSQNVFKIKKNF